MPVPACDGSASPLQLLGAGGMGVLIGWYLYYINRYRAADVKLSDLVTLVSVLGGGAILRLYAPSTDLFGAYGIGLVIGFFGYFAVLLIMVARSDDFTFEWFLDGRRRRPVDPFHIPQEVKAPPLTPMRGDESRVSD